MFFPITSPPCPFNRARYLLPTTTLNCHKLYSILFKYMEHGPVSVYVFVQYLTHCYIDAVGTPDELLVNEIDGSLQIVNNTAESPSSVANDQTDS